MPTRGRKIGRRKIWATVVMAVCGGTLFLVRYIARCAVPRGVEVRRKTNNPLIIIMMSLQDPHILVMGTESSSETPGAIVNGASVSPPPPERAPKEKKGTV